MAVASSGPACSQGIRSGAVTAPPPRPSFPTIDILRGFAAISVVVYHVIEHYEWSAFPTSGPLVWFRIGWMGVDLFFVISGFVITLSIRSLLDRLGYREFLREFAMRRLARIVPLYYATCIVYVIFVVPQLLPHPGFYRHVLAHAAFLHNLTIDTHGSIDGPNWSVAAEMQFYAGYALLAPVLLRLRWWQALLGAIAITWAWRLGAVMIVRLDQPSSTFRLFVAVTQLPGTLDEFAVGMVLARAVLSPRAARLLIHARRAPVLPIALAAGSMWLLLAVYWHHASFWDVPGMVVVWHTACAATFAVVLFAACSLDQAWFVAATAPLRYLGTISFGIYLWHLPVLMSVQRITWMKPDQALWYVLSGTLIMAAGSWHLLERPALHRGRSPGLLL